MNHLRTLVRDLVERRLWPVALALVIALVAVPVVLGRGGEQTPAPIAAAPATGDSSTAQKAEVTLDTGVPRHPRPRRRRARPVQGLSLIHI